MTFSINYFDGKSSKTHPATVNIYDGSWNIKYTSSNGEPKLVQWKVNDIKKSDVYTKGLVAFSFGNSFPFQRIESNDSEFINFIAKSEHKNINNKLDTLLHTSVKKSILLLIAIIIGFSFAMYFYVLPSVASNFAQNLPKQRVIEFGDYVFKNLSHTLDIDKQRSKKLQNFVNLLNTSSQFPVKAYVAKSDQLNAFALSGGTFVIYTGLLDKIENEHQLSALIGHELSHIENRHMLKSVSRNLSGAIFVSIIFGDVNAITSIVAENAHLFSQMSFTRNLEKEADIFGMHLMKRNNLNLHGMPELFEILNNNQNHDIDIPSFLNSHPMLADRIEYTKQIANTQNKTPSNPELKTKWLDLKNKLSLNE